MDDVIDLRAHAIPLAGVEPDLPEDDLDPLLERLIGARLVGLGEATHGDHESFAFKCRLIQALVRRGRCDVVIFERNAAEMGAYDRYVTGASDDLPMGAELYPWRVEEARDLFRWLRGWNATGGRVRVAGMDMQSPAGLPLALRQLDEAGIAAPDAWRQLAAEVDERQRDLAWLEAALAAWRATVFPSLDTTNPQQRWIGLLATTFGQWLEVWPWWLNKEPTGRYNALRDRCMAENALAQLDRLGPAARGVIWAHNFHIWLGATKAGNNLRTRLGPAYQAVGFVFGGGTINAGSSKVNAETKQPEGPIDWTLRPQVTETAPPGSLEHLLGTLDLDRYAIAPTDVAALRRALPLREIGIIQSLDQFASTSAMPAEVFDLLVFFREVQPSRLLPTV